MSQVATGGVRAAIREVFDTMPRRTRRIAMFGFITLAFAWVLGVWYLTVGGIQSIESDLVKRQKDFNSLKVMQAQFDFANQQIQEAETRLGKHKGMAPSAFLEQAATQAGVKDQLTGINERDSEVVGSLKQTRYKVTVKMAPVADTMNFLHAIEDSGFMAIETLEVTSKFFSGEKRLTAQVDLIAYATTGATP